jgi:ATP-dependent exoDNAse (exonuclease V) alpha subunit
MTPAANLKTRRGVFPHVVTPMREAELVQLNQQIVDAIVRVRQAVTEFLEGQETRLPRLAVALRVMASLTRGVADQQRANRALQARIRALIDAAVPTDDDL